MGKMSELMIENHHTEQEWEVLLQDILEGSGMGTVSVNTSADISSQEEYEAVRYIPDFSITPQLATGSTAVELKVYRWKKDWVSHFRAAVDHLSLVIRKGHFAGGILVVTLDLERVTERDLFPKDAFPVEIWDLSRLRRLVQGSDELANRLEELAAATLLDQEPYDWPDLTLHDHSSAANSSKVNEGSSIALSLQALKPGLSDWSKFEKQCEVALRLLFGDEIVAWSSQKRIDDGLNRMDLIGRINVGTRSFWSMVEQDFRTRYVVFEAKNYTDPITQGEIYTTEKYLFTKALRSFALIVARNGYDDGAAKAISGSLREQGKLILVVTLEELCTMLEKFDQGEAPENLLFQKMDDLLMSVGR